MTLLKKEQKVVLLLSPQKLVSDHSILESLHVTKSANGIDYKAVDLVSMEIDNYFARLPRQARDILAQFNKAGMLLIKSDIKKKFELQKAGVNFKSFYKLAISRKLHEMLEAFKPYAPLLSWYHKIEIDKARYAIAPAKLSSYKPQLEFLVTAGKKSLHLEIKIRVNGTPYHYSSFRRQYFLLESNNEYFLLSFKDYQTLEWLQNNDPSLYGAQPTEFAKKILAKLETDYTVDRNNLLPKIDIWVVPENRVLLSEISQKFLVFTPQWLYDGFLLDGPYKEFVEITKSGDTYLIRRDREAETAFLKTIESLYEKFSNQLNGYYYLSFDDAQKKQWFLKTYHHLLSMNIQIVGMDMLQHFRYSTHKISFCSEILSEKAGRVSLKIRVAFGKEEVPLLELQKLLLADQRSVLLKDGTIGIIDDEWLQNYGAVIRHGKITDNEVQVAKWLAFSEEERPEKVTVIKSVLQSSWREKWRQWQETSATIYPIPAVVNAVLRPYQAKGFEWMTLLAEADAGACLADDMGLGKTLQTICFLAHQQAQGHQHPNLIVCPASLIYNWQQEFTKFAPAITTFVHHGASRSADLEKEKSQVIITTYGTLRSDIENVGRINFGVVVLDESHNIKNPSALITRAVGQLHANTRVALSGTPIMNNTFDLYAQLNFVLPGIFGSRDFFKKEYADSIDREHNPEKIAALKKLTDPFVLRRTKQQVATDLPTKTEIVMWCTMGQAQKNLYDEVKTTIRASLFLNIKNEGLNKSKLAVIQGMMKLRQLCNSPMLLPAEDQGSCVDSVKTDLLMNELANNLKEHKVLVFSQFSSMLQLLASACREQGIAYYHFDGQTPPEKRAEMVDKFQQEDDTTNVFLISLKAGNAGLNLTAADYVFLFDPWWNTAVQQQAIDRTHRIGQTKNIFAYKMVCKDTIEEKIIEIQQRKKKLAEDLVTEDEGFVKSLNESEIDYLFS